MTSIEKGRIALPEFNTQPVRSILRDAQNEEESKKFAYAAQKTIQTLQDIIDEKNNQLERKDDLMKKMREDFLNHKNMDAERIKELNEQIERNGILTLDGLRMPASRVMVDNAMVGKVNANEVEAIMLEKDRKMEMLLKELDRARDDKNGQHERLRDVLSYFRFNVLVNFGE